MYDPFFDALNDEAPLQTPIAPSRSTTPATGPVGPRAVADPKPPQDAAALFDPLGILSYDPPAHVSSTSSAAVPHVTQQPRPRPDMLPVAITTPAASVNQANPLRDLISATPGRNEDEVPTRPQPLRKFSTTPLFHTPPLPKSSASHPPPSGVKISTHAKTPSDDFGSFVSVPATQDPLSFSALSSVPEGPSATSNAPGAPSPFGANDFTTAAQQRHSQNASRVLGELKRGDERDALGWLDPGDAGDNKEEEGPHSPPATPVDGPPPAMKMPRRKTSQQDSADGHTATTGSYFPASLPRRLTSLISNPGPATAQMSPVVEHRQNNTFQDDPHGILALPTNTSVSQLSSLPAGHAASAAGHMPVTRAATVPTTGSIDANTQQRNIPDAFVTHKTPFSTIRYVPPSGAPGFLGNQGWDTGGFAADWDGDDNRGLKSKNEGGGRRQAERVMRLTGRKEETAGVLTTRLADQLRPRLPALARLSTKWTLLYSMDQHGISLHTFYNLSSASASSTNKVSGGRKGALLVVRDALDGVFGVWIDDGIRTSLSGEGHYGGGDSFMWKATTAVPDPSFETEDDEPPAVEIYKWTGRNGYVALCEPDFVSLGGGEDGKTGLYLESSLLDGSSAKCMTFNNDVLCAEEEENGDGAMGPPRLEGRTAKFEVIGLEVWGLVGS